MTQVSEEEAIKSVVRDYFEGVIYDQPERIRSAMHPKAHQAGHYNGEYEFFDRDTFVTSVKPENPLSPGAVYEAEFEMVDITGTAAVAKFRVVCFGENFTDYLSLIKDDGKWTIVMKIFVDHKDI
ncbi:nuclear transport factor 2 family protein (plasmid) [Pseudohalocynthiibacter aestuariivivens]|nr:nuclear transport factor 2 family protein [Pseudohalocynthiibacter aestuariivivens]QIE48016.1 nuclear transport factor 2 family protein [Pseudohalocynthiibacter aestuariivivens]